MRPWWHFLHNHPNAPRILVFFTQTGIIAVKYPDLDLRIHQFCLRKQDQHHGIVCYHTFQGKKHEKIDRALLETFDFEVLFIR